MRNTLLTALFTFCDLLRSKAFYIALGISILMLFMIKGCYTGDFTVNGEELSEVKVSWYVMKLSFHITAGFSLLVAALLSSKLFNTEDGSIAYIMSKPVKRYEFAAGRILGTWAISFGFMLLMHSAISLFSLMEVDAYIQNYLLSSLVCSLNILLVVILSSLLSLKLPDSGAVILTFIICGISFVSDLTQKVLETDIAQQIAGDNIPLPSIWRQVYPQMFSLQFFSIKLMDETAVYPHHSLVHPVANVLIYIVLFYALSVFIFRKKEIN